MGTSATHGLKNGPEIFATYELSEVLVTNGFSDILTFIFQKFCITSQLLATLFMKPLILIEIFKVNMNGEWERCSGHTKKIEGSRDPLITRFV